MVSLRWPSTTSQRGNVASFCGDGARTTAPRKCVFASGGGGLDDSWILTDVDSGPPFYQRVGLKLGQCPAAGLAAQSDGRPPAQPVRLATRAQAHGTPQLLLSGPRAEAVWDAELAPTMEALGIALHEEAALDLLLEDLG